MQQIYGQLCKLLLHKIKNNGVILSFRAVKKNMFSYSTKYTEFFTLLKNPKRSIIDSSPLQISHQFAPSLIISMPAVTNSY